MSVNLEVKGSLAKCLATENLIIEHKKVPTACFDVDRRVLTLPMWDKASATVYDLLVGHEVGHALYTDNIDWTVDYPDVPKDFVNVIEDARVERLMKKKYPGLSRTFYTGYNELNDSDFFSTKDENLDKLSFIDRINLYFKIGAFHNIDFSDEENEFLTQISLAETFKQVLDIAKAITEFVKYRKPENLNINLPNTDNSAGGNTQERQSNSEDSSESDEKEKGEGDKQEEDGESQGEGEESDSSSKMGENSEQHAPALNNGAEGSNDHPELQSKTSRSFDENSQSLTDKYAQETAYVELPEMYIDKIVIPNHHIHSKCKEFFNSSPSSYRYTSVKDAYQESVMDYMKYKKSAEKEVSYLVKEFECKKSADQYARSSTARTGVLDTAKLHTYKFNEDLFKKVSVVPDGKNHGLIFILDWSGSMVDWILDTYKQLLNLIWFCRKVNIPFEVYAFTLDCNSYIDIQPNHPEIYKKVKGILAPEGSFRLMNFLTSNVNNRVLDEQLKNIWYACWCHQLKKSYLPRHLELSGTPLGESIMSLHYLIPEFQRKHKLQKVNVIFLTDGEGYDNPSTVEKKNGSDQTYISFTKHNRTSIRDRRTGRVYKEYEYGRFTQYSRILLETVRDRFPTVNLINFRISTGRDFLTVMRWYGASLKAESYSKLKADFLKEQSAIIPDTGYDKFYVIASGSMSQDEDFTVNEGATTTQIKTAFTKLLSKKKTNKKILSSFVELIS